MTVPIPDEPDVIPEVPWWPQEGVPEPTPWDEDDTALPPEPA